MMAFIFVLFLFPDFTKAETLDPNSYSEVNRLKRVGTKESSTIFFLKDIPRTKVSIEEKNSLSTRNPFLPFGKNSIDGKSGFTFSEIYLTGIANKNGEKVAFIKTSEGTFHYQEGEIIGSGFILLNIDDKNLTIQISNDIPITNDTQIRSIKLIEDEK